MNNDKRIEGYRVILSTPRDGIISVSEVLSREDAEFERDLHTGAHPSYVRIDIEEVSL